MKRHQGLHFNIWNAQARILLNSGMRRSAVNAYYLADPAVILVLCMLWWADFFKPGLSFENFNPYILLGIFQLRVLLQPLPLSCFYWINTDGSPRSCSNTTLDSVQLQYFVLTVATHPRNYFVITCCALTVDAMAIAVFPK